GLREPGHRILELLSQPPLELLEPRGGRVDVLEQLEVTLLDHAVTREGLEIDDLAPIAFAIEQHRDASRELSRLREHQDLAHLVERAEPAWTRQHRAREV